MPVSIGCSRVVANKVVTELTTATVLESCGALLVDRGWSVVDNKILAELVRAAALELTTVGKKKKICMQVLIIQVTKK